jgi:hypothetical protein
MNFINHGEWERYVPDPWPEHLSNHKSIMFCRRIGDGIDWYKFQRSQLADDKSFSIKMTLLFVKKHWQVQATYREASYIFPANHKLIEIEADGDYERFRRMRFNLEKGEFYAPAPDPVVRTDFLIILHKAGLLKFWEEAVDENDMPIRLSLMAERPFDEEDDEVISVARRLGWNDTQLKQLFDDARQMIRSRHG